MMQCPICGKWLWNPGWNATTLSSGTAISIIATATTSTTSLLYPIEYCYGHPQPTIMTRPVPRAFYDAFSDEEVTP